MRDRGTADAPWIDTSDISDPVKRLRFLRLRMAELDAEERSKAAAPAPVKPPRRFPVRDLAWVVILLLVALLPAVHSSGTAETIRRERGLVLPGASPSLPSPPARVWLVEQTPAEETYSNGLHIDLTFSVSNPVRKPFPVFPLNGGAQPTGYATQPVGIVYHTVPKVIWRPLRRSRIAG